EVEDPRKELVRRLVEYQRYQEASKKLYDRPLLGRDVFKKGGKTASFHSDEDGEIILDEGGLFSLIGLYRGAVRKMKKAIHRVGRKSRSIAARILEIKDKFVVGQKVILRELIDSVEEARGELLITFLSALELGKMGFVSVYQSEIYGDIYLTAKKPITGAVVSRVEEYDSQGAEDLADTLMEQAAEDQEEMAMMEDQEPVEEEVVEPTMNFEMTQQEFTETQQEMTSQEGSSDESEEFVAIASDSDIEEAEQELNIDMNENTEEMIVEDNLQADRDGELT
ncbi:MAG: hypothetical protein MJK18_07460, partial [Bdellovibrionales bacterium]|nr:hypothetical protein [Bdellovibrionales bacterium]